jgi:YbbR domain-containing protein
VERLILTGGGAAIGGLPQRLAARLNLKVTPATRLPIREESFRIPRGIQVVDVSPRRVRVVLERAVEREVEVNPRVEGRPPDGYAVRQVTANPSRVRMVGPASELTRITRVRTLPISVTGQTASFSARALLEPVGRQVRVEDSVPIIVQVDIEERKS